jgi:hypothetical protein
MVKLKFKQWSNVGDVLTSEELKHVCGGLGSGSDPETYCAYCVLHLENKLELVIACESLPNQNNCNQACVSRCNGYNGTANEGNKCKSISIDFLPC